MKTFFNYIEDLTESNFVNITGATQTDFKQLKIDIAKNRFLEFAYIKEFTLKALINNFLKDTEVVQLEPLAEKPLSSQLYWLTDNFYSDLHFERDLINNTVINKETKQVFKLASQTEEKLFKLKSKHKKELEEFTRLHKYDNYGKVIIDLHNKERWREGLKLAKEGNIVEMTEDAYYHFLECVPPKDFCRVSFVCGEPNDHNNKGEGIYLCGIKKGDKFYAQYGTVKEYREKQLFKFI